MAEERAIPAGDALIKATLSVPLGARGVVVLLHAVLLRAPTLLIVGRDEQARAAELASEFFARKLVVRSELCPG